MRAGVDMYLIHMYNNPVKQKTPDILFLVYIAVLVNITVIRHFQFGERSVNLTLFTEYLPVLHNSLYRFAYLFLGNIIWFMPLGFYLVFCRKLKVRHAVVCGFLFSLFIEIMQYVLGTGIAELDDLILNTFGSFLGAAAGHALQNHRTGGAVRIHGTDSHVSGNVSH